MGPTADPFAWDSTVAAFAFTAGRIFGVGANRWLVTEEVIEEAFASAGEENLAPDALAAVGVEDPAPEDTLAVAGEKVLLQKMLWQL